MTAPSSIDGEDLWVKVDAGAVDVSFGGSTIGQPVYRPRSPFILHSFPSAAVECGKEAKRHQGVIGQALDFQRVDVLPMEGLIT